MSDSQPNKRSPSPSQEPNAASKQARTDSTTDATTPPMPEFTTHPTAFVPAASDLAPSDQSLVPPESTPSASLPAAPEATAVSATVPPPPQSSSELSTGSASDAQTSTRKAAPRPRSSGITVDKLRTVRKLYEDGDLEEAEEEDLVYPYVAELNEKVVLWRGNICKLEVDAIVNAANKALLGGGGVDGAIHSAAGGGLYEECKLLGGAATGETKITRGHRLPAAHVLHTVGPMYARARKDECARLLRSCYQSCLELAVENGLRTIAFSGISTGIYGYPLDDATQIALDVTRSFLAGPDGSKVDTIIFTVFRDIDVESYVEYVPKFFPAPPHKVEEATTPELTAPGGSESAREPEEDTNLEA